MVPSFSLSSIGFASAHSDRPAEDPSQQLVHSAAAALAAARWKRSSSNSSVEANGRGVRRQRTSAPIYGASPRAMASSKRRTSASAPTAQDDKAIWLEGNTATGTVGLAPNTDFPFTGTKWTVVGLGPNGEIGLHCEGHLDGPRWLDGNTLEGTTWLRPNTNPPYTGTKWRVLELGNRKIKLLNLGLLGGADSYRYLYGDTKTKTTRVTNYDGDNANVWEVWYAQ
jgi:hypothetical protein